MLVMDPMLQVLRNCAGIALRPSERIERFHEVEDLRREQAWASSVSVEIRRASEMYGANDEA